jgi:hypothetical protein
LKDVPRRRDACGQRSGPCPILSAHSDNTLARSDRRKAESPSVT